jgi:hypothetical protein
MLLVIQQPDRNVLTEGTVKGRLHGGLSRSQLIVLLCAAPESR